ncbi:MAG: hypothetical protein MJ009_07255 [Paludibacteraceae bacterium]|nr:hypothetical protein [Paludibacteraceae bacterium]
MIIEIRKDIIDKAVDKSTNENLYVDFLRCMVVCAKHGKHIVYVPCLYENRDLEKRLKGGILSKKEFAILNYAGSECGEEIKRLLKIVKIKAIVSDKKITHEGDCKIIEVSLVSNKDVECYEESHIITENINDFKFYRYVCYYFQRKFKLQNCDVCAYSLMGGGITTADVFKKEISERQHLTMAIVDSDKKWPKDNLGSSAKQMKDIVAEIESYKPYYGDYYVLKRFPEIENLIPHIIVKNCSETNPLEDLDLTDKYQYYDMKCGVKMMNLFDNGMYKYWKNILGNLPAFEKRDEIKMKCHNRQSYKDEIKANNCNEILPGYGKDLLIKVLKTNYNDYEGFNPQNYDLGRVDDKSLTPMQKEEWGELGRVIFSWTCAMKSRPL